VPIDSPQGGARVMRFDLAKKDITIPAWELQVWKGGVAAAPAIHTDTVYFAADVGTVYAVGAERREPIWPLQDPDNLFDARSKILAPLKADDVGLYISCTDGHFYCVNRTSGKVKWQYFAAGPLVNAPVLTPDTVFIIDPARGWVAIDKVDNPDIKVPQFNRSPRWVSTEIVQVLSQDDKYVYAKDKANHIVAYDKKTGERKFTSQRSDFYAFGTSSKGDGFSYTASRGGRVVAIRPVLQSGQTGEMVRLDDDRDPQTAIVEARSRPATVAAR
jgi:outer membrane protein assembly factor BamB